MPRLCGTTVGNANLRSDDLGTENPVMGITSSIIAAVTKRLVPRKSWAFLSEELKLSERVAKHRMGCTREFTAGELVVLLRSEKGKDYLVELMGDAQPLWWRRVLQQITIADARALQARAKRKLKEAIDESDATALAIERAETALSLQDENFYREHFTAVREASGVANSAVARKRGR